MTRLGKIVLPALMFLAFPVFADPIPDYVLDNDFKGCMGNEDAKKDPERQQYCSCIRDGLKTWDLETYTNEAMAQSQKNSPGPSAKLSQLASACIAKVLK